MATADVERRDETRHRSAGRIPVSTVIPALALVAAVVAVVFFVVLRDPPKPAGSNDDLAFEAEVHSRSSTRAVHPVGTGAGRTAIEPRRTVQGRVVDRDTLAGVGGVDIAFGSGSRVVSDNNGEFSLVVGGASGALVLQARAPEGWALERSQIDIGELPTAGGAENPVEFRAYRIAIPGEHVLLLDAATGEVVPDFAVELESGHGERREARSDALGRVDLGGFATRCTLRCIDIPELAPLWAPVRPIEVLPSDGGTLQREVRIPVGPTYRVEADHSSGLSEQDFRATLEPIDSFGRPARDVAATPLRAGGTPWLRFGPIMAPPTGGPPWALWLADVDGVWSGSARVDSITGVYPDTVHIVLQASGCIAGTVTSPAETPLVDAVVRIRQSTEGVEDQQQFCYVDASGGFKFERLRPGSYAVNAMCSGHRSTEQVVDVQPATTHVLELRLEPEVALGSVSGALSSVTGQYDGSVMLTLRSTGVPMHRQAEWRKVEERFVAPFRFDEVPIGECVLSIHPSGGFPWDRYEVVATCPASGLDFICQDDTQVLPVCTRVFDARSGIELPSMWSYLESSIDGSPTRSGSLGPQESGSPIVLVIPGRTSVSWIVGAPGYAPRYGDESSFTDSESGAKSLELEVRLDAGWGVELEVRRLGADGGRPLSGVEVQLDGQSVGRTGALGTIRLAAQSPPARIVLKRSGMCVVGGDVDVNGALVSKFLVRARVWMRDE